MTKKCHILDAHTSPLMNLKDHKNTDFIKAYDDFSDDIFRFCYLKTRNRNIALDITKRLLPKFGNILKLTKKSAICEVSFIRLLAT